MSASSKISNGALPPSSSASFFMVSAHWRYSRLPTAVDPVKDSTRTFGLRHITSPASAARVVVTTLNTPAGTPASCASLAMARAQSGVSAAGLATMVQPAASAAPTLRVSMAIGKFQGVMATATPQGWRMVL